MGKILPLYHLLSILRVYCMMPMRVASLREKMLLIEISLLMSPEVRRDFRGSVPGEVHAARDYAPLLFKLSKVNSRILNSNRSTVLSF